MRALVDINPRSKSMLVSSVAAENLADGRASTSLHERQQNLLAHAMAVLDLAFSHNDAS